MQDISQYASNLIHVPAKISSGTKTATVFKGGTEIVGIYFPTASGITSLTFAASPDDSTYYPITDVGGNAISYVVGATSSAMGVYSLGDFAFAQYLKISANANAAADLNLIIVCKPLS